MKKMLVKAVALSLVMGGVGFAANDALAADPLTDIMQANIRANAQKIMQNQKDIAGLQGDVATNKDNIATNNALATKALSTAQTEQLDRFKADVQIREDMKKADAANAKDIAANKALATRALSTAQQEQLDRFKADVQITEDMKKADKELSNKIDKETSAREFGEFKLNTKINAEGEARVANDKLLNNKIDKETNDRKFGEFTLNTKINAEGEARVAGDELLNKKIDSNAAKVQEQLDAQVNKNNAQDASIKANGAAIKANKDAIKANADAIKANKDAADATNTYFNGRIENNTANIDKNKVAIENEAKDRKDADQKLQKQIDKNGIKADTALKVIGNGAMQNGATNLTDGVNQNTRLVEAEAKARDDADKAEAKAREEADTKLQNNINAEATTRENAVNALNSRIDQLGSDATKGIAKASALAALHPLDYDPDNKFDIAAAGGFYKGENAFALGAFYRPNRNVMLSMGTTLTSGDNAYNVGLTFKIGKSGKHTETGLTTADLYAMIGAMQDKMDQQQKKIEELEAKQAK